jgi:NAD dependent epimerase/dehydratase family enzyme
VNAVSPDAVSNEEFTKGLAKALHRPSFLRMPCFLLRALFGEMSDELLLSSQRVVPAVLEEEGFRFEHPTLTEALKALIPEKKNDKNTL